MFKSLIFSFFVLFGFSINSFAEVVDDTQEKSPFSISIEFNGKEYFGIEWKKMDVYTPQEALKASLERTSFSDDLSDEDFSKERLMISLNAAKVCGTSFGSIIAAAPVTGVGYILLGGYDFIDMINELLSEYQLSKENDSSMEIDPDQFFQNSKDLNQWFEEMVEDKKKSCEEINDKVSFYRQEAVRRDLAPVKVNGRRVRHINRP